MKKLLLLLLFIGVSTNAQFRSNLTKEQYTDNVDNYKPDSQVISGKNTTNLAFSYTDILTWGGSVEVIKNDIVNDKKPFYELYGSIDGEFDRVTITVKMGVTSLKQMDSLERTTQIVYGGTFEYRVEYRVVPNLGIVVGSDSVCDTLLGGLVYHFEEK